MCNSGLLNVFGSTFDEDIGGGIVYFAFGQVVRLFNQAIYDNVLRYFCYLSDQQAL